MNPFKRVREACEARVKALSERAEAVTKGQGVAREALKLAVEAEAAHEKLSPSKPRAAAKPAKTK
jgi:hypothetical protein